MRKQDLLLDLGAKPQDFSSFACPTIVRGKPTHREHLLRGGEGPY